MSRLPTPVHIERNWPKEGSVLLRGTFMFSWFDIFYSDMYAIKRFVMQLNEFPFFQIVSINLCHPCTVPVWWIILDLNRN